MLLLNVVVAHDKLLKSIQVPRLYRNGVIDWNAVLLIENKSLCPNNTYCFKVEYIDVNDVFKVKIHSTEGKYNSPFSNYIRIDKIRRTKWELVFFLPFKINLSIN